MYDFLRDSIRHPSLAVQIAHATAIPTQRQRDRKTETNRDETVNENNVCVCKGKGGKIHFLRGMGDRYTDKQRE